MSSVRSAPPGEHSLTLYDVAQTAGVSHTTVSRALNGQAGMTDETRRHVLEIIARLGYSPNISARVLAGGVRPQIAAVVAGGDSSPRSARLVEGVSRAGRRFGYAVTMLSVDPSDDRSREAAAERIGEQGIRGAVLILNEGFAAPTVGRLGASCPSVVLSELPDHAENALGADAAPVIALAADHLRELGHRSIALVSRHAGDSAAGSEVAHGAAGSLVRVRAEATADGGLRVGQDPLALAECTALIAPTVSFAVGVVRGLRSRGVRVPEDFAVVSLEDHMDAAHVCPPLTAVATPVDELTRWAVAILHAAIEESEPPLGPHPIPRLVVRESTARIRATSDGPQR